MVIATRAVKREMGPVEWGLLLLLALMWGGSFFFSRIAVGELPPLTVVLIRVALAALALNAIVLVSGRRMPRTPSPRSGAGAFAACRPRSPRRGS